LINVALQLVTVAVVPLNLTVLEPCVEPKFVPLTVTAAPIAPEVGDKLVMFGAATTVKLTPLLDTPLTVTTTLPVVAPLGTVATIEVALQLEIVVAVVVLNFTVLDPCVEPKFVPVIVTDAPTAPEVGDKLEMVGAAKEVAARTMQPIKTPNNCAFVDFTFGSFISAQCIEVVKLRAAKADKTHFVLIRPHRSTAFQYEYVTVTASIPPAFDEVSPRPRES